MTDDLKVAPRGPLSGQEPPAPEYRPLRRYVACLNRECSALISYPAGGMPTDRCPRCGAALLGRG